METKRPVASIIFEEWLAVETPKVVVIDQDAVKALVSGRRSMRSSVLENYFHFIPVPFGLN